MMNESMERILFEALDLMEQGASIDEIVARYPDQSTDLRPFLMTAAALSNLATQPTLTAQAQSRRAFLAAADQAVVTRSRSVALSGGWLRRLAMPLVAALVVLVLGGAGLARASGSAVPGDALYETKRLVEDIRLNLTSDPELAAELRDQFRLERVREIEQLLAGGRVAEVSLTGAIESMAGDRWMVASVPVIVASGTAVDGAPQVGALVQVDGRTAENGVVADRVMVLSAPSLPEPTPNPEPAVTTPAVTTPTPSTPRPSATAPADDDNDNGDDGSEQETPGSEQPPGSGAPALPTLSPTTAPTSTSAPTATSTDDDNGNANDDNANDNDDNANDNDDDNGDDNENGGNDDDNANDNGDDNSGSDNDNGGGGGENDNGDN